jgi:hypothetical protein
VLFTVFADNVSLEIHLAQRMSNLTTVENWVGCPTTPLTKLLVASASYSEPKIFHFLVLVRNCETWVRMFLAEHLFSNPERLLGEEFAFGEFARKLVQPG